MEIRYEDIKRANDVCERRNIKGKDYIEVPQRIKAFRMVYPRGTIRTDMIYHENGMCVFRAEVYDGDLLLASGTSYEKLTTSGVNSTSYIENAETSAVGRALGMAGFGSDTSLASYEEVANAILAQGVQPVTEEQPKPSAPKQSAPKAAAAPAQSAPTEDKSKASEKQIEMLRKFYTGENLNKLLAANGITRLEDISRAKASELIGKLTAKKPEQPKMETVDADELPFPEANGGN